MFKLRKNNYYFQMILLPFLISLKISDFTKKLGSKESRFEVNLFWKEVRKIYHTHGSLKGLSKGSRHLLLEFIFLCSWRFSPFSCIGCMFQCAIQYSAHWKVWSTRNFPRPIYCTYGLGLSLFNISWTLGFRNYPSF